MKVNIHRNLWKTVNKDQEFKGANKPLDMPLTKTYTSSDRTKPLDGQLMKITHFEKLKIDYY